MMRFPILLIAILPVLGLNGAEPTVPTAGPASLVVPVSIHCVTEDGTDLRLGIVAGGDLPAIPQCRYWYVAPLSENVSGPSMRVLADWMRAKKVAGLYLNRHRFSFSSLAYLTDDDLASLAGLPDLRVLLFPYGTKTTVDALKHIGQIPRLTHLVLPSWRGVEAEQLAPLAQCKSLEALDLTNVHLKPGSGVDVLEGLTGLKELRIDGSALSEKGLPLISRLPLLEKLAVHGAKLTPALLQSIAAGPSLKGLTLRSCRTEELDWSPLKQLRRLESLECDEGPLFPYEILASFPSLRTVSFGYGRRDSPPLTDLSLCPQLEEIRLGSVPTAPAFWRSLANLPKLRKLDLHKLDSQLLTVAALTELAVLPQLQELHLPRGVTDAVLGKVALLRDLRVLALRDCEQVTDAGIAHFSQLKGLRVLDLQRCRRVTNAGLARLAELSEVESLCLRGTGVNAAGLSAIRNWRRLRKLDESIALTNETLAVLSELPVLDAAEDHWDMKQTTPACADSLSRVALPPGMWLPGNWPESACQKLAENRSFTALSLSAERTAWKQIGRMRNLTELGVICDTAAALRDLEELPHLTSLNLSNTKETELLEFDAPLGKSIRAHESLLELSLSSCRLSDEAAEQIAQLPLLSKLDLYDCLFSEKALSFLARLPGLRHIWIRGGEQITDAGIKELGNARGLLELRWNPTDIAKPLSFSGRGWADWPDGLPLARLGICNAKQLNDAAVEHLMKLRQLVDLELTDCAISDASLDKFRKMPNLVSVNLFRCRRLSYEAVKAFRKEMEARPLRCSVLEDARPKKTPAQMLTRRQEAKLKPVFMSPAKMAARKPGGLDPDVVKELTRLGATELPPEKWRKFPFADKLPKPLLQLLCGYSWPPNRQYGFPEDVFPHVDQVDFTARPQEPEEMDEFLSLEGRPFFGWALAGGDNYIVAVPCDTDMPEDPPVYVLDHEETDAEDAKQLTPLSLSVFLQRLKSGPKAEAK